MVCKVFVVFAGVNGYCLNGNRRENREKFESRERNEGKQVEDGIGVSGKHFRPPENGRKVSDRGYLLVNPLSFSAACVVPLNSTKQQLSNSRY